MDTLLAGTCVKIIELAANCVSRLRAAEKRYQKADLTITLLLSHLITLKAALFQIQTWVGSDSFLSSQHYQLIMDVDAALAGCHLLLGVLDERIFELGWESENELDFTSKARVVLNHKVTKECIAHLSHQTIALNLLLTAFQCQTQTEQLGLLQNEQTRYILNQIKDDSSSLVVLRDEASMKTFLTGSTHSSSMLLPRFGFDGELFQTQVYQDGFRSFVRRATRPRKDSTSNVLDSSDEDRVAVRKPKPEQLTILYSSIPNKPDISIIKRLRTTKSESPISEPDSKTQKAPKSSIRLTEITTPSFTLKIIECSDPKDPTKILLDHFTSPPTTASSPRLALIEIDLTSCTKTHISSAVATVKIILTLPLASQPRGVLLSITRSASCDGVEYVHFIEQRIRKVNRGDVPLVFVWDCRDLGVEIEKFARQVFDAGMVEEGEFEVGSHTTLYHRV